MHHLTLPHAPTAARTLRSELRTWLAERPGLDQVADDAILVASELCGNAVLHARPLPDGGLRAGWQQVDAGFELEMTDGGSLGNPEMREPDADRPTGRGLAIVNHLVLDWGVRDDGPSSTVWVLLPLRTKAAAES